MMRVMVIGWDLDDQLAFFDELDNKYGSFYVVKGVAHVSLFDRLLRCTYKVYMYLRKSLIRGKFPFPFYNRWLNEKYLLGEVPNYDIILLTNGALSISSFKFLNMCRRMGKLVCLFLLDSWDAFSPNMINVKLKIRDFSFDRIYTFDQNDAENHHFNLLDFCYYSKIKNNVDDIDKDIDLYFVGGVKGNREHIIMKIFDMARSNGCKTKFVVYKESGIIDEDGIQTINTWVSYRDNVLFDVLRTNCICEIMQKNQTGASLRYFEAVVYNKKLLTNNQKIIEFPYYNPRWMKIITKIEDIDTEWIKRKDEVDYQYKGDFSPNVMVNRIICDMASKSH